MSGLFLVMVLLVSSNASIAVTTGVLTGVPKGYVVSNIDPAFDSAYNSQIYIPNFQPGFEAGLTNTSIYWSSGNGYANLGYSVGPWAFEEVRNIPHFAVGPQCCNFKEVPHTQQFSKVEWGNHYYSRAGLGPPGINVENYTAAWGDPSSYIGLRTDWDWTVQFSFTWNPPVMTNPSNEWGAIGIAASQYVQGVPGDLVYTLVNFWMDSNSSASLTARGDRAEHSAGSSDTVVYHPIQMTGGGNQTVTLDISPFLADTVRMLGFQPAQSKPPVITYVYLNVEGYNLEWNSTLWSFKIMTPTNDSTFPLPYVLATVALVVVTVAIVAYRVLKRKASSSMNRRGEQDNDQQEKSVTARSE